MSSVHYGDVRSTRGSLPFLAAAGARTEVMPLAPTCEELSVFWHRFTEAQMRFQNIHSIAVIFFFFLGATAEVMLAWITF